MKLSEHFTLDELTRSETALRKGIDNVPHMEVLNLTLLCEEILEPVRELLGVPLKINSGYRSAKLNKAVGGAKSSAHLTGNAADFEPVGMGLMDAFDRIRASDVPFDQIIQECGPTGWIHVARAASGSPRRQALLAKGGPGAWEYFNAPPLQGGS